MSLLVTALAVAVASLALADGAAQRPVIGIMSSPYDESNPDRGSFILSHYVSFLEAAGARVVPLLYDSTPQEIDDAVSKLNGVLFTGGGLSLGPETQYWKASKRIFDLSMELYANAGDVFPLWGTCMGFQLLCILSSGGNHSVLVEHGFDSSGINLPLEFLPEAKSSYLFGTASQELFGKLATRPITVNLHHDGVEPSAWAENPLLQKRLAVLSTNRDLKGRQFVSSVEGRDGLPIMALQWHAERPAYCWDAEDNIPHTDEAIEAGAFMARRFVERTRSSNHAYPRDQDVPLIQRSCPLNGSRYHFPRHS